MEKKFKLGVIGAGFMASAIVKGAISSKIVSSSQVIMSDVNDLALQKARENYGVSTTSDNSVVFAESEYVLLAVKPQSLSAVFDSLPAKYASKIISIMAGVKKQKIKAGLGDVKVARCMPNTPCSLGCGAIGVDLTDYSDKTDRDFIVSLLSALAVIVEVPEEKLNAVTGVSGSSPAYFYLFLKGIIDAGIKHGLSEEEAKTLAVNTMIGSGKMVLCNPDKKLDDLITAVCSKGGTTIQAVNVYNDEGLNKITEKAVDACVKRSFELENL